MGSADLCINMHLLYIHPLPCKYLCILYFISNTCWSCNKEPKQDTTYKNKNKNNKAKESNEMLVCHANSEKDAIKKLYILQDNFQLPI